MAYLLILGSVAGRRLSLLQGILGKIEHWLTVCVGLAPKVVEISV